MNCAKQSKISQCVEKWVQHFHVVRQLNMEEWVCKLEEEVKVLRRQNESVQGDNGG